MDISITNLGYSIKLNSIDSMMLKEIKDELTVKPELLNKNYLNTDVESFEVYRVSKNSIYIPRYYGISKFKNTQGLKSENLTDTVPFNGVLRELQNTTIEATMKTYSEYGGGLVSLDTGLGKTVVALKLISMVNKKTLIIVHAQFLLEQWLERINTFLPTARVGIIRQDVCDYSDKDIVVGMLQSIIKREYPKECMKSFGHLIIDEVHHIGSKTFSSIFFKVQCEYMLGLSATPERKDGLSKIIYWFLGPQIVDIKRTTDKPTIKHVFTEIDNTYIERYNRQGVINSSSMITDLTLNHNRNELIISEILLQLKESRKILVLSHRRAHCEYLYSLLKSKTVNCGLYLGGMKTESRNETTKTDVILGTYQASGEGFDVPELDTLILSTPKSDIQQAVGRILRQKNNNIPIVVDIVDLFSIFKGQHYSRKKYFKLIN